MRINFAQIFTASAAVIFIIVLFSQFGGDGALNSLNTPNVPVGPVSKGGLAALMTQSETLWKKTVKQRHAVTAKFPDMGLFPATTVPNYFTYPYSVWDLVPASWNCPHEVERIGRMGDGGKWVCGMSKYEVNERPCILYSFGIQNESSFEEEMLERTNCQIWGYDFSVDKFGPAIEGKYTERTHFKRVGIAGTSNPTNDPPFYSIQDLMSQNGHDYIDILKMDIEFAEYEALTSLLKSNKGPFPIGQMLIELHLFEHKGVTLKWFLDWWETLEEVGLRPAWTEPNLLVTTLKLEDAMPRFAEYSLVNTKNVRNKLWIEGREEIRV